jgi:hypothetical protein
VSRSEKAKKELHSLKNYLLKLAEEKGVKVIFHPHELYGYQIPFLHESVTEELTKQVNPVSYLP